MLQRKASAPERLLGIALRHFASDQRHRRPCRGCAVRQLRPPYRGHRLRRQADHAMSPTGTIASALRSTLVARLHWRTIHTSALGVVGTLADDRIRPKTERCDSVDTRGWLHRRRIGTDPDSHAVSRTLLSATNEPAAVTRRRDQSLGFSVCTGSGAIERTTEAQAAELPVDRREATRAALPGAAANGGDCGSVHTTGAPEAVCSATSAWGYGRR